MNVRGEGVEDESNGWAWEFDPSAEWVLGDMREADQEAVHVMASAIADLAAAGLTVDGLLADDPNPLRLRT